MPFCYGCTKSIQKEVAFGFLFSPWRLCKCVPGTPCHPNVIILGKKLLTSHFLVILLGHESVLNLGVEAVAVPSPPAPVHR